jgi:hypothetical protein
MLITVKNKPENLKKIVEYLRNKNVDLSKSKFVVSYEQRFSQTDIKILEQIGELIIVSSSNQDEIHNAKFYNPNQLNSVKKADIPSEHSKMQIYKLTQKMLSPLLKQTLNLLLNLVTAAVLTEGEEVFVLTGEKDFIDSAFLIRVGKCKLYTDFSIIQTYCSPYV